MLKINTVEDISNKEFQIIKYNDSIYNTKILNKNFIIDSKTLFSNCSAFFQKIYKIRININNTDLDHIRFKKLLKFIHNEINTVLENEGNPIEFLSSIKDPIIKSNALDNTEILHLYINKYTKFINYENNAELVITELINKRFEIYPIINCPSLNINNAIYINYYLRTAYIRFNTDLEIINKTELNKIFNK